MNAELKIPHNCVRDCARTLPMTAIGAYYTALHVLLMFCIACLLMFSNSVCALLAVLNVLTLDAFANFALHDCPLTHLERKYLGCSMTSEKLRAMKDAQITYRDDGAYELQIEVIINAWTLVAVKLLVLLVIRMCGSK